MSTTASQLIAKVSDQGAEATAQKMRGVGASVDEAGDKIRKFAVGAAVAGTAAIVGIGVASVKMAGDFQSEMTSLVTGAGESESNLKLVSDGILNMAPAVGTTTKQLADGMYLIESSGQHGAQALETLKNAAMGAKVGSADLGTVANGVTTIMTDYADANVSSAQATNTLIATVAAGKTHMADLANSLAMILPTASAAGVSLGDVSAAMATMTGEGTPAADAATYLRQTIMSLTNPADAAQSALANIGLTTEEVSDGIKKSLPDTLKLITDHLKQKFPEGSAAYVAALADIAGGSKQMQGILELTGSHLDVFKGNVAGITDAVNKGGNSITGWNKVQGDFNFQIDKAREIVESFMIKLGTGLLPILTNLSQSVLPSISAFANWVTSGQAMHDITVKLHPVIAYLSPLFTQLGTSVQHLGSVVAPILVHFGQWLVSSGALRDAVVGIVVGVGLFVQGLTLLSNGLANVITFFSTGGSNAKGLWSILVGIGSFLTSTFKPVWDQLVSTFQSQLLPAWDGLVKAIQPVLPALGLVAVIIGGVLVGAIGGLLSMLGGLLKGVIQIFGGVVQIVSGAIQTVLGIFQFFTDLTHGNFSKLGADLGAIWQGVAMMFEGIWNIIAGLFSAFTAILVGFVSGFITSIVGYFKYLYDILIGHSIIPDMINGIVSWFQQLPGRAVAFVVDMATKLRDKFMGLVNDAPKWASDMINGFIDRIRSLIGNVGQVASDVAGQIRSFLHFSVPDVGPLADADEWMEDFGDLLTRGLNAQVGKISGASVNVAAAISPSYLPQGTQVHSASQAAQMMSGGASGGGQQQAVIIMDGHVVGRLLMPHIVGNIRLHTGVRI
jgi:TP901 family phage tail tape measure protein